MTSEETHQWINKVKWPILWKLRESRLSINNIKDAIENSSEEEIERCMNKVKYLYV